MNIVIHCVQIVPSCSKWSVYFFFKIAHLSCCESEKNQFDFFKNLYRFLKTSRKNTKTCRGLKKSENKKTSTGF